MAVPSEVPHLENVPCSSVLSKSHNMFLGILFCSHYHIEHNSQLFSILPRLSYISALVTQEIPIIVDSYLLVQLRTFISRSPRPIDNDTFPTIISLANQETEETFEFDCCVQGYHVTEKTLE